MPRYRFQWTNLSPELIEQLAAGLKLEGDAVDALIDRYGSRPKPAFLQDAWSILLDIWLSNDPVAAKQLAIALKERSLGDVGIEDDITYLKSCRNTIRLREVALDCFISLGESGDKEESFIKVSDENGSAGSADDAQTQHLSDDSSDEEIFRQPVAKRQKPQYKHGFYAPSDYELDYEEVIDFPPGKYFLGDPSLAIPKEYIESVNSIPYGEYMDIEGLGRVAVFHAGGDGCYEDDEGHPHFVVSGCLGVAPIDNLSKQEWIRLASLGRIIDIDSNSRPSMPFVDDDGYDTFDSAFQLQSDSNGNLFLGWNWIFCGDVSHLLPSNEKDASSDNDDEEEPSRWQLAQNAKVWYERRVDGLSGSEYASQNASFIRLYMNQFAQDHPRLPELSAWLDDYCARSYTDLHLGDGPAFETYKALQKWITDKYKYLSGSEEYAFLIKAAAECAVGCCIEINDTIYENSRESGE